MPFFCGIVVATEVQNSYLGIRLAKRRKTHTRLQVMCIKLASANGHVRILPRLQMPVKTTKQNVLIADMQVLISLEHLHRAPLGASPPDIHHKYGLGGSIEPLP